MAAPGSKWKKEEGLRKAWRKASSTTPRQCKWWKGGEADSGGVGRKETSGAGAPGGSSSLVSAKRQKRARDIAPGGSAANRGPMLTEDSGDVERRTRRRPAQAHTPGFQLGKLHAAAARKNGHSNATRGRNQVLVRPRGPRKTRRAGGGGGPKPRPKRRDWRRA